MAEILVIEDNISVAKVLQDTLSLLGWVVTVASSGYVAEKLLKSSNPSLIFMDLSLPGVDGISLIKEIRENPLLCQVPVILVTAAEPGSDGFPPQDSYQGIIHKPFDIKEVMTMAAQYLPVKEKAGASA